MEPSVKSTEIVEAGNNRSEHAFKYQYRGNDRWIGTGGSYKINKILAVGISHFVSFANFDYKYTLASSTYNQLSAQRTQYFSNELLSSVSNNFSMVTKFGMHLALDTHQFGIVVKTPIISKFRVEDHLKKDR